MDAYACNACVQPFQSGDQAVALGCCHLFCRGCADNHLHGDSPTCPVCSTVLAGSDVHHITIEPPDDRISQWALVGRGPEGALSAALTSVQFLVQQAAYVSRVQERAAAAASRAELEDRCKQKLGQIHTAYKNAKRKYDEAVASKRAIEAEHGEIREKYRQKALETQNLRESMSKMTRIHRENEDLRQICEKLARHAGVDPRSLPALRTTTAGGPSLTTPLGQMSVHPPLARYNSPSSSPHGSALPLVPRASTPYPPFSAAVAASTPLHSPAYNHATDFDTLIHHPIQSGCEHRMGGPSSSAGYPYRSESGKKRISGMQLPMGPPAPRMLPDEGQHAIMGPIMSSPCARNTGFRGNLGRTDTGYQQVHTRQPTTRYAVGNPSPPLMLSGGRPFDN